MIKPRVKICCISSVEEADMAIRYGASALGLVSHMPSGPGVISDDLIKEITAIIPSYIDSFLLSSATDTDVIIDQLKKAGTNTIQIVDELKTGTYSDILEALPGIQIVQVIHVIDENSIKQAQKAAPYVDAILLDSGKPKQQKLGGTGKVHNWAISRKICKSIEKPVYLAGGLNARNVAEAIKTVRPFGLDLCSGVRTDGKLDETKLSAFFDEIG